MKLPNRSGKIIQLRSSHSHFNRKLFSLYQDLEALDEGLDKIIDQPSPILKELNLKRSINISFSNLKSLFWF